MSLLCDAPFCCLAISTASGLLHLIEHQVSAPWYQRDPALLGSSGNWALRAGSEDEEVRNECGWQLQMCFMELSLVMVMQSKGFAKETQQRAGKTEFCARKGEQLRKVSGA